jgi:hypothetical protein
MQRTIVRVPRTVAGLLSLALLVASSGEAAADSLTFTAGSNGFAESPSGNGNYSLFSLNPTGNLVIRQIVGTVQDVALMSFDLSGLPTNAVITGASFDFQETVLTTNVGRVVDIEGFASTAPLSSAGATAPATLLGQYDNVAVGLGPQSIGLSLSALQGVLTSGSEIDIRLRGDADGVNTAIASLFAANLTHTAPPQLVVTFTAAPEPSSLAMIAGAGLVGLLGYGCRRHPAR